MGFLSGLLKFFGLLKTEAKIVVIGLDNSGKTTIINNFLPEKVSSESIVPTVACNVETFVKDKFRFSVIDMSGASSYRNLWESYYSGIHGIIFVVDSTDIFRLTSAKDELDTMLLHRDIKKSSIPILVYANKSDLPGADDAANISMTLGLPSIKDRAWQIQSSNALTGEGIEEGFQWLINQIIKTT